MIQYALIIMMNFMNEFFLKMAPSSRTHFDFEICKLNSLKYCQALKQEEYPFIKKFLKIKFVFSSTFSDTMEFHLFIALLSTSKGQITIPKNFKNFILWEIYNQVNGLLIL